MFMINFTGFKGELIKIIMPRKYNEDSDFGTNENESVKFSEDEV